MILETAFVTANLFFQMVERRIESAVGIAVTPSALNTTPAVEMRRAIGAKPEPSCENTTFASAPPSKCFATTTSNRVRTNSGSASPISNCLPETRTFMGFRRAA